MKRIYIVAILIIVLGGVFMGFKVNAQNKFPESIKVGGLVYKLEFKDLAEEDYMGLTDFNKQTITIDSNASEDMKNLTLLHEIIHTVNTEEADERVVDMQAQGLYQVIKDNNLFK